MDEPVCRSAGRALARMHMGARDQIALECHPESLGLTCPSPQRLFYSIIYCVGSTWQRLDIQLSLVGRRG